MSHTLPTSPTVRQRWGAPRCGYRSNRMMLWIGSRVLWLGYFFVWCAALYFFLFVPRARRASIGYLDRLRPNRSLLRRWWDTYRHMIQFGLLLLDRALMLTSYDHGFAVSCDGLAHLTKTARAGNGVIMYTAHFGNAEVAAPYMFKMGVNRPIHLVMYRDSSDSTERFHTEHRRLLANVNVISTTDPLGAGLKIMAALKKGDLVAMRADRTMAGKSIPVHLLGGTVQLPAGPFVAAALSNAPAVNVYTIRLGYRRYLCMIGEPRQYGEESGGTREERIERAAKDFAAFLESMIRRSPLQWANFYDLWADQPSPAPTTPAPTTPAPAATP